MYRAFVARGNYMAQDRTDVQFAVKELCRSMSNPTAGDWAAVKRLGRYLVDKTRVKVRIPYQEAVKKLVAWVDTDYAGCRATRKSTSGGRSYDRKPCDQGLECYPGSNRSVVW